jgi:hypothetical protein
MSPRVLIAIAVIVIIIVTGMVVTVKRSLTAGAMARDPDVSTPREPPKKN